MLRKLFLFTLSLVAFASMNAQNLQLHFDPRHSLYGDNINAPINYLTATFEMFKPDAWGSTFMFVDFDFNFDKRNPGLAYAEIARAFKIGDFPLMPHLEYNGGLGLVRGTGYSFSIPSSYLAGMQYPFQLGNFFMGTYLAYKLNAFETNSHDVQWTLTWNSAFPNSKVSLAGFLDLWTENKNRATGENDYFLVAVQEDFSIQTDKRQDGFPLRAQKTARIIVSAVSLKTLKFFSFKCFIPI